MRAPKERGEIRRRQLARAALRLAGERGLEGMGVADVAREAGLTPTALYRHFSGKDELLRAALNLAEERLGRDVKKTKDGTIGLRQFLRKQATLLSRTPGIQQLLISRTLTAEDPAWRDAVEDAIESYLDELEEAAAAWQRSGQMRGDLRPRSAAVLLFGALVTSGEAGGPVQRTVGAAEYAGSLWQALRSGDRPEEGEDISLPEEEEDEPGEDSLRQGFARPIIRPRRAGSG